VVLHARCYTSARGPSFGEATALRGGPLRSLLHLSAGTSLLVRPPPCAVVIHARCYTSARAPLFGEATALRGGPLRSLLHLSAGTSLW